MATARVHDVRLAADRPHGILNQLYTPEAADFALDSPIRQQAVR